MDSFKRKNIVNQCGKILINERFTGSFILLIILGGLIHMSKIYEAVTINTGGREGKIYSKEKNFLYNVTSPGSGVADATNPEELFAAAYSACFNGALELVMSRKKLDNATSVRATVALMNHGDVDFSIEVLLEVFIEGMSREEALHLVEEADQVCPYSKALRGNTKVIIDVVNEDF